MSDTLRIALVAEGVTDYEVDYPVNPIPELAGILPCERPCPPPKATTDKLRAILLSWIGEQQVPPQTVLCTPSKSTDAWVVAIFFPNDREMKKKGWECHPDPQSRFGQQPKKLRFVKSRKEYQKRKMRIKEGWPQLVKKVTEAKRFQDEFQSVIEAVST